MSELKSVLMAIDVAARQRDGAGKVLAQAQSSWRSARQQMEQLESYAADTDSKWAVSAQIRAAPEIMRHYCQFMDRLQQAISLQRHAMADLDQEFRTAKALLLAAEIRIARLNRLLEKKQSGMYKAQAGREQKQLDEFAAMQQRRLRAGFDRLEIP